MAAGHRDRADRLGAQFVGNLPQLLLVEARRSAGVLIVSRSGVGTVMIATILTLAHGGPNEPDPQGCGRRSIPSACKEFGQPLESQPSTPRRAAFAVNALNSRMVRSVQCSLAHHLTPKDGKEQGMLRSKIVSIVNNCTRHAWTVIAMAAVLTFVDRGLFSARTFSINTDINKLISPDLPWRQREIAISSAFRATAIRPFLRWSTPRPRNSPRQASTALVERLKAQPNLFTSVENTAESPFFTHNGLLFLPDRDGRRLGSPVRPGATADLRAGVRPDRARPGPGAELRARRHPTRRSNARRDDADRST